MSFTLTKTQELTDLQATLSVYQHEATGLQHYHLTWQDPQYAFLIAFPTLLDTDDGRAHVLEHFVLCGSKKFPVRDPFFEMMRRSVATFMNAMTYSDRTVYPFATPNAQDFEHLMSVYLDTVLHPTLERMNFLQEGWRHVLTDEGNLQYQGVVFNEMKGALMSGHRIMGQGLNRILHAGTTYGVEAGGDPLDIPQLTLGDVQRLHAECYHPSGAIVMTSGPDMHPKTHELLEAALVGYSAKPGNAARVTRELSTLTGTVRSESTIPVQGDPATEFGLTLAWVLGPSLNADEAALAEIVSEALFSGDSSPLQVAMAEAGFGRPGGFTGLDDSDGSMVLLASMEGLTEEELPQAEALIRATLAQVAEEGFDGEYLQHLMRDASYRLRQVRGGNTPYALNTLLPAVPYALFDRDPAVAWSSSDTLNRLEARLTPEVARQWVLDLAQRPHLTQTFRPDPQFFERRETLEAEQLASTQSVLSEADRTRIRADNAELARLQEAHRSADCLPVISVADLKGAVIPDAPHTEAQGHLHFDAPLRGTMALQVILDASQVPAQERPWLDLAWSLANDLGLSGMSWAQAQRWREANACTFHLSARVMSHDNHQGARWLLTARGGTLDSEAGKLVDLMQAQLSPQAVVFNDPERLSFLIESSLSSIIQDLPRQGNDLMHGRLMASMSPAGALRYQLEGLPAMHAEQAVLDTLARDPQQAIAHLERAFQRLPSLPVSIVSTGGPVAQQAGEALRAALAPRFAHIQSVHGGAGISAEPAPAMGGDVALLSETAVSYHSWAVRAPAVTHPDAPVLNVLGPVLTHGLLHRVLREQGGAYGGSATYGKTNPVFMMSTYRDPRFSDTYADFERARTWALEHSFTKAQVDEGIRYVLQGLDTPYPPLAHAGKTFNRLMRGTTTEQRQAYRERILSVSAADLSRVAQQWLTGPATRVSFTHPDRAAEAQALGLTTEVVWPKAEAPRARKAGP